jgi:RNA polymerase sigma factor (sigma-70 family)
MTSPHLPDVSVQGEGIDSKPELSIFLLTCRKILFTQEQLVDGIRANDAAVLRWLYQSQYPKVRKFVLDNSGDEDQAKDLFQEAFIAFWNNVKDNKFQPENSSALTGYLYQIAKNKWLDFLRSSQFKKTVLLQSDHDKIEDNEDNDWMQYRKLVAAEIKNLGDNCREILRRFYFAKESMELIAKAFAWTEATARNNKYRCIQRLREKVKTQIKS